MAAARYADPRSGSREHRVQTAAQAAAVAVLSTADVVRRSLSETVDSQGLTLQQFNVLRILRGAGSDGLPTLRIGERMVEKTPGLTGLLDRLAAKKLVTRRRCAVDRRRVYCAITGEGLVALESLDAPVDAWERSVVGELSAQQIQNLIEMLGTVRSTLDPSR